MPLAEARENASMMLRTALLSRPDRPGTRLKERMCALRTFGRILPPSAAQGANRKLRSNFLLNKKESRSRDSPPAAGRFSDIIPFRRSAFLPGGLFNYIGEFGELSYVVKNPQEPSITAPLRVLFSHVFLLIR